MKGFLFLGLICCIVNSGCSIKEREKEIDRKLSEINQKEQELILKEKTLQLKEADLLRKEMMLDSLSSDSAARDTMFRYIPGLAGVWTVKMNCIETSCSGSAIGDTRTEQWEIAYQDDAIIAKAMSGNKLIRIYSGAVRGNFIQLATESEEAVGQKPTRMLVRLQEGRKGEMEGRREIIRPEECRIVYRLDLKKN